jgi:geranylgeranyl transferase type-2 subunit beta
VNFHWSADHPATTAKFKAASDAHHHPELYNFTIQTIMSLASGPGRAGTTLPAKLQLAFEPHVSYIQSLDTRRDELEYWLTEHLRLNGLYWGLTSLHIMGRPDALPRDETIAFVMSCQKDSGGFGAAPDHDAHLLSTVSAVQILAMVDAIDVLEKDGKGNKGDVLGVGKYLAELQNRETGTFKGDEWGEEDTRFLYAAMNVLSLLKLLHLVDVKKAVEYIQSCANFDGGYGVSPGAESHSGQIFACLAALSIAGRIDVVEKDKLGRWLSERQVEAGGLNGRPEKDEDVCYSWWVASSLTMIDRLEWIDKDKLSRFILQCQVSVVVFKVYRKVILTYFRMQKMAALRIGLVIWWTSSIRILDLPD